MELIVISDLTQQEILQYAISNGNLDVAHIQEQIHMKSKIEILKKHPYAIWQGKDENWYTYLPGKEKGRVKKKKILVKKSKKLYLNTILRLKTSLRSMLFLIYGLSKNWSFVKYQTNLTTGTKRTMIDFSQIKPYVI